MILVDTSVWIDHLHRSEPLLIDALERGDVATHDLVIEELALGSLASRASVIADLHNLVRCATVSHDELLRFVDADTLWGRGLSVVDIHLLASTLITPGGRLWTRDKRLRAAADDRGVAFSPE